MSVNPRINITTVNSIDTKTACFDGVGDYDPSLERFLGEDPIGFSSGNTNFYRYVKNSPVNFFDPSGLKPDKDKVYHCSSSNFWTEHLHAFNCAGGKCSGNYPAWTFQDWTTKPWFNGEIRDDTNDFDNPNYTCEEEPRGNECNWNVYRQCMINFVNSNTSFGYDITWRQCRSWAWRTEDVCREVSNCE